MYLTEFISRRDIFSDDFSLENHINFTPTTISISINRDDSNDNINDINYATFDEEVDAAKDEIEQITYDYNITLAKLTEIIKYLISINNDNANFIEFGGDYYDMVIYCDLFSLDILKFHQFVLDICN